MSVLIVEHDADTLDLLLTVFRNHGAHVYAARTARQAIRLASISSPDVAVLNLDLPDATGYAALGSLLHPLPGVMVMVTHEFFAQVNRHLGRLHHFVRPELRSFEAIGDLGRGEVTEDDIVDAVLLRAYREFMHWAPWCGPCRMVAPVIDELAAEMAGRVRFAKLNIDENPAPASRFGVRSIPTLLVLKGGQEVDRIVGVQPKPEIARRLARVAG